MWNSMNSNFKKALPPSRKGGHKNTGSKITRNRVPWAFVELSREKTVFEIPSSVIDNQKVVDAK